MKIINLLLLNKNNLSFKNNEFDLFVKNNEKFHLKIKNKLPKFRKFDFVLLLTNDTNDLSLVNNKQKFIIASSNDELKEKCKKSNLTFFKISNYDLNNNLELFKQKLCLKYLKGDFYYGI